MHRRTRRLVAGALALVVALRILPISQVYRGSDVVLSSNDPYYYRYWVDRLTAAGSGILDVHVVLDLPGSVATGEPLLVTVLWWFGELLGGSPAAVGSLLAWYPVVSALATGAVVYVLAARLGRDPRVGLAAVGFLAVAPGHAFRTGIGFADHHAFDYFWLALTVAALVSLVTDARSERAGVAAVVLGTAIGGQSLAWESSPLLLVPAGLCVAVYAPMVLRGDGSLRTLAAIVGGFALGAGLTALAHFGAGWHAEGVVATPALLSAGTLVILLLVAGFSRMGLPAWLFAGLELVGLPVAVLASSRAVPGITTDLQHGIEFLLGTSGIGETISVLGGFGPVVGPVVMLGFSPFLALPPMVWAWWHAYENGEPDWLFAGVYAWYFLGLSLIQRRFVGELAPIMAAFAGLGLVYLLFYLDVVERPGVFRAAAETPQPRGPRAPVGVPERQRLAVLGLFAALLGGFSSLFTAVLHANVTTDARAYQAARRMREYGERHGMEYPRNYVFSEWGRNRMYNYFVNGHSRSYRYARERYGEFLFSLSPGQWYEQLRDRAGFVVTTAMAADLSPDATYVRLHERLGSESERGEGVAHYRAVYVSPDGAVKAFALVPGATIVGETPATERSTVEVVTEVRASGTQFRYSRRATTDEAGQFSVTVPYPGRYELRFGDEGVSRAAIVPERAVVDGTRVETS